MSIVTNLELCHDLVVETINLSLLYYSHIPPILVSLLLGYFVFFKNKKDLASKVLFYLSISFSVWAMLDLFAWISTDSRVIMFTWSSMGIFSNLIFVLSFYFLYVFIKQKDLSVVFKYILGIIFLPMILMTPTELNLYGFKVSECVALENNFLNYIYVLEIISILLIIYTMIYGVLRSKGGRLIQVILASSGLLFFLISFSIAGYLSVYFSDLGILTGYSLEAYSLWAMLIFLILLSYIIVKFKTFDIKLIGPQALVWALVILVGSQFFYIDILSPAALILAGFTLVISSWLGLMLVRSVKKEIAQREELGVANQNQQLLIRFITHQVKGFFTKSKMVFATILEGDLGEVTPPMKELVQQGLESDNKAVDMVQEVLSAASLRDGRMTYNFEEVDFGEFVKGLAEGFRSMAVEKKLQYEVNVPATPVKVKIDKLQMTQVIKNLIDNSIKYTLEGTVKVDVIHMNKTASFQIHDTGVGLSDSDKAKLFKEGGRGDESLKFNVNSTGYGLFIVKKIIEGHSGKIWATSAGRGHGSQFFAEIPSL